MGALEDVREAAAAPRGPRAGSSQDVYGVAQLISVNPATGRATVTYRGSQPLDLPYNMGAVYTGITTVDLLCSPADGGRAVYVLGPRGVMAPEDVPALPPAPPATVPASALIFPTSTQTWRSTSTWDRYTGGDGALSDLYQGPAPVGGILTGLACYGDQVVNLGATSITSITAALTRVGTGATSPVTLTLQGSPHGSRPGGAPSGTGDTASLPLNRGQSGALTLTSAQREGLRTGAFKGLLLMGAAYAGVKGVTRADGMALAINYLRPA